MKKYLSTHSGSVGRCHNSEVMELFCRIALPKSSDNRRSDILIPNGLFSDLILIVWCLVGFPLLIFGHWKSVMLSFLIIVFILKVVDVLRRFWSRSTKSKWSDSDSTIWQKSQWRSNRLVLNLTLYFSSS